MVRVSLRAGKGTCRQSAPRFCADALALHGDANPTCASVHEGGGLVPVPSPPSLPPHRAAPPPAYPPVNAFTSALRAAPQLAIWWRILAVRPGGRFAKTDSFVFYVPPRGRTPATQRAHTCPLFVPSLPKASRVRCRRGVDRCPQRTSSLSEGARLRLAHSPVATRAGAATRG